MKNVNSRRLPRLAANDDETFLRHRIGPSNGRRGTLNAEGLRLKKNYDDGWLEPRMFPSGSFQGFGTSS